MSQEKFLAILPCISSDLAYMIMCKEGISQEEAIRKLYDSKLYALLENEETKVWQYSTPMLYTLLEQEFQTGIINFPDV